MRINGICPFCYIARLLTPRSKFKTKINFEESRIKDAKTPIMGWSSWNTFKNTIDENVIYESAKALRDTGLLDAGYRYINIDDNWMSGLRDEDGKLQGDLETFPSGIPNLVKKINDLGIKVGIYTSNGTETCENLPSSLYREQLDANTFAEWGVEYFKYDFCNNIRISKNAPIVYGIRISQDKKSKFYPISEAKAEGFAKIRKIKKSPIKIAMVGLDGNKGSATYENIEVAEDGQYVLSIDIIKKGQYRKYIHILVNDKDEYGINIPSQKWFNNIAKFQTSIKLNKGKNTIKLFNPISSRADSAMYQYRNMDKCLDNATMEYAKKHNVPEKPITFSICEWGFNRPWKWGTVAGNSWRTTMDIFPKWWRVLAIYKRNVRLYKYSKPGHWNDPDMLEVGNGNFTEDENKAHFSAWAMMNAPLILGNDLRNIDRKTLRILTNIQMIKINQDPLGKQAKRIKKGSLDILAKPLVDGKVAVCFFNKKGTAKNSVLKFKTLQDDPYINLEAANTYSIWDVWESNGYDRNTKGLDVTIDRHAANVYIITPKSHV